MHVIASNFQLKRGNNQYKRGKRATNTSIVQSTTFKIICCNVPYGWVPYFSFTMLLTILFLFYYSTKSTLTNASTSSSGSFTIASITSNFFTSAAQTFLYSLLSIAALPAFVCRRRFGDSFRVWIHPLSSLEIQIQQYQLNCK